MDLSEKLADPVDVLFGTQLGGGTDINLALAYTQTLIRQPQETILVLISDLYEGGDAKEMLKRMTNIVSRTSTSLNYHPSCLHSRVSGSPGCLSESSGENTRPSPITLSLVFQNYRAKRRAAFSLFGCFG